MRARTSRQDAGMDLFPFMAVLICTVGALIMLLVVMVQQARVKANAPVVAETKLAANAANFAQMEQQRQSRLADHKLRQQEAAEKQAKFDEYKWKAELLRSSYEATVGQVTDQRLALSHLESHTRELSERAGAMQAEADLIAETAKQAKQTAENPDEKLEQIKFSMKAAELELTKAKDKLKKTNPKYVLIPYAGPNGTDRRPIYIECLPDRVVLQPENVTLIGEDFLAPLTIDNPLARALRAKREFLQENNLISADSEPYPLLVVRPGAAASYAAARSAMTSWDSEFGYELIENDVELDYSDADPRLKQLLEDVVIDTRGRRRMMRSMQATRRPRKRERLRPSASGGFELVSEGDDGGGRYGQSGPSDGRGTLPFETSGEGRSGLAGRGNGYGVPGDTAGNAGGSYGSRFESGSPGNGTGFGQGYGGTGEGQFRNGPAQGRLGSSDSYGAGGYAQSPHSGQPSSNSVGQGNSQFNGQGSGQYGGQGNGSGPRDGHGYGDNPRAQTAGPVASRPSGQGQSNPFRGGAGGGQGGLRGQPNQQSGAGGNAAAGGPPGASGNAAGASGGGGTSADAGGSGGKGTTGGGGSSTGTNSPTSSQSVSGTAAYGGAPQSLAESRGSGWANANLQHDAVGIQRPIYVACNTDTISLLPERGTRQGLQTFRHRGNIDSVVEHFVKAVQKRMDSWGIAGHGIYWKPVLQIKVGKNADHTYQRLMHLLDDSGIEVTREP